MVVLEAHGLERSFVSRSGTLRRRTTTIEAVRGLDLSIESGELFGLLGPNGAGKTTTIKMLITLLLPTAGTARVLGYDLAEEPAEIRRRIGYVFGGDRGLYDRLNAYDNLRYFAELYGVDPRVQRTRIPALLEMVGLSGGRSDKVEGYSRGMRQRLHIARGLMHNPDLLFLDEPSIGIDPVGARELRATIALLREQGKTVVLTTHYMFEADELCDRIAVISAGRLVAEGTPAQLKERVSSGHVLEVELYGNSPGLAARVREVPGVTSATLTEAEQADLLTIQVRPGADVTAAVLGLVADVRFGRVATRAPTLEDAYVELVTDA